MIVFFMRLIIGHYRGYNLKLNVGATCTSVWPQERKNCFNSSTRILKPDALIGQRPQPTDRGSAIISEIECLFQRSHFSESCIGPNWKACHFWPKDCMFNTPGLSCDSHVDTKSMHIVTFILIFYVMGTPWLISQLNPPQSSHSELLAEPALLRFWLHFPLPSYGVLNMYNIILELIYLV